MGLAGPRKRVKLSHDPNNTNWSKDTDSYGHKILASQGWQPGQYLGAENANHREHYGKANASHIRVLLREDNLGLGAKIGAESAEKFGLSQFSGLLGRLNGKTEEVSEKQKKAQADVKLAMYQGRKYGHMPFVSAGFLVGDRIERVFDPGTRRGVDKPKVQPDAVVAGAEAARSDKKRKRDLVKDATVGPHTASGVSASPSTEAKAERRERRKREKAEKAKHTASADGALSDTKGKQSEAHRKAEKAARKEERRRRRERKAEAVAAAAIIKRHEAPSQVESGSDSDDGEVVAKVVPVVQKVALGRHTARHRYIQQKRMAAMDPQALKEACFTIFIRLIRH